MGAYVADAAIRKMVKAGQALKKSKVVILSLTFKENCPDTRNSKVDDIIKSFNRYRIKPVVVDPWANERDARNEYGVELTKLEDVRDADCVIVAVAHNTNSKSLTLMMSRSRITDIEDAGKVLIDVNGLYKIDDLKNSGLQWWRL